MSGMLSEGLDPQESSSLFREQPGNLGSVCVKAGEDAGT